MEIVLVAFNIRSTHNVGSILRTADGFGVSRVYLAGYTPYPALPGDTRLPHLRDKLTRQIHKTALGAEATMPIEYAASQNLADVTGPLRQAGYSIAALEQSPDAIFLDEFWNSFANHQPPQRLALIVGNEVEGLGEAELAATDICLEIRMHGHKESFNVSVATGVALYELSKRQH